jgi:two-component system response regulator RegA
MSVKRSVLVVDDDEQLQRLIVRLLEREGHRIHAASNVPDALALFDSSAREIDLALLDVNLSANGGAAELLPLLHERAPGLDVVLMSGDALPETLESALSARGGRFLRKPFAPKALLRLLAGPADELALGTVGPTGTAGR